MRKAIKQVRREGRKAALIYAVVDAVAIFLAVNVLLAVLDPPSLPAQVAVPSAVTDAVASAADRPLAAVTIPSSAVVGAVVGLFVFVADFGLRLRRPLVERFEAVNPTVSESLRTARDALDDDTESRMATRLYEDVLAGLKESSSVELVDVRRVLGTVLVVVVLSIAAIQVASVNLALLDGDGSSDETPRDQPREFTGLEDGDRVLGDPEDVAAGDDNLTAQIDSTGGEDPLNDSQQFPSGDGGSSDGSVESQQSGFAGPEELEDAELIREYNLRIRDRTDSTEDSDT